MKLAALSIYHAIFSLLSISYFKIITTPPGTFITTMNQESQTRMIALQSIQVKRNGQPRFCMKCEKLKPDRTHHCSMCQACVLKMDHHCVWVNNCTKPLFISLSLIRCWFLQLQVLLFVRFLGDCLLFVWNSLFFTSVTKHEHHAKCKALPLYFISIFHLSDTK